jgi:hypothetical protein
MDVGSREADDRVIAVNTDRRGNVIITGNVTTDQGLVCQIRKYGPSLRRLISSVSCGKWGFVTSMIRMKSGNVIVAGIPGDSCNDCDDHEPSGYPILREYRASLDGLVRSKNLDAVEEPEYVAFGVCMVEDERGNVIAAIAEGITRDRGPFRWRITRYSPDLRTVISATVYQPDGAAGLKLHDMVVDDTGAVILAGAEKVDRYSSKWVICKYSPSLARLESSTFYYGAINKGMNYASKIELDARGDIYVLGDDSVWAPRYWASATTIRKYNPNLSEVLSTTCYQNDGLISVITDMSVSRDAVFLLGRGMYRWWVRRSAMDLGTADVIIDHVEDKGKCADAGFMVLNQSGQLNIVGVDVGGPGGRERWRAWKYGRK